MERAARRADHESTRAGLLAEPDAGETAAADLHQQPVPDLALQVLVDAGAVEADPALADQAARHGVVVGQAGLDEQTRQAHPAPAQAIAAERYGGDLLGKLAGSESAAELGSGRQR